MDSLDEFYSAVCESIRQHPQAYRQAVLRWCQFEVQRFRKEDSGETAVDSYGKVEESETETKLVPLSYTPMNHLLPAEPMLGYQFAVLAGFFDCKTRQQSHQEPRCRFAPEGFVESSLYLTLVESCKLLREEDVECLRDYLAEVEKELRSNGTPGEDSPPVVESQNGKDSALKPSEEKAWLAWKLAEENNPGDLTDQKAYDWLSEQEFNAPLAGYDLPAFATWAKYVRKARKYHGEQKYQRRAGRATGSSVVRQSEI